MSLVSIVDCPIAQWRCLCIDTQPNATLSIQNSFVVKVLLSSINLSNLIKSFICVPMLFIIPQIAACIKKFLSVLSVKLGSWNYAQHKKIHDQNYINFCELHNRHFPPFRFTNKASTLIGNNSGTNHKILIKIKSVLFIRIVAEKKVSRIFFKFKDPFCFYGKSRGILLFLWKYLVCDFII